MRSLEDVRPLHLVDVQAYGKTLPVYAWLVDDAILVDTGMIDSTPELDEEWGIELRPWPALPEIRTVINTHLHFDHCGGNRRFAGVPTYVQRVELANAVEPDYLVDWVRFDGADYVELDGDTDLGDGISVLSTPGHSPGHQCVVVETGEGPVVLGGDVTYSMGELIASRGGSTERPKSGGAGSAGAGAGTADGDNFRRIHELRPRRVYLAHSDRPWDPTA